MLHLARRFFGFLTADALTPAEQIMIGEMLTVPLQRLFYLQRSEDQRHALDVAKRVVHLPECLEAALLHDVGKTKVDLGAFGRASATLWSYTPLPITGRWRTYLEHGRVGAELLTKHGAGAFAVSFARLHPGPPPDGFDTSLWARLAEADGD